MRAATIIPLVRLPRTTGDFSYSIPDGLLLQVGHLVSALFRGRPILGLVHEINDIGPTGITLKPLTGLVNSTPLVSAAQIAIWHHTAKRYGVHTSVVCRMGLLPLKKTKLAKMVLLPLSANTAPTNKPPVAHWLSDQTSWVEFISSLTTQAKTAVILPEQWQLGQPQHILPSELQAKTIIWDSQLSEKDQFINWLRIRNGDFQLLLGTRGAIFLPLLNTVEHLVLDFEANSGHKHWDQQPRFHTQDVATWIQEQGMITLHASGPSLSIKAAHQTTIPTLPPFNATIVHYTKEAGSTDLLARPLTAAILDTAQHQSGDIVCLLNRRGLATTVVCRDCGFVAECPNCRLPYMYEGAAKKLSCRLCNHQGPALTGCPKCQSPLLAMRGGGTERVAAELQNLLAETTYQIHTIDRDSDVLPPATGPRCLIGTDALMSNLDFSKVALLAVLDTDASLARAEYTATANAWHRLADLRFWLPKTADLYLQTRRPDHPFYQHLSNPADLYHHELTIRQALNYPPYCQLIRFLCPGDSEVEAVNLASRLKNTLTTELKIRIVQGPITLVPAVARGRHWVALLIKLAEPPWTTLEQINRVVPPEIIVDPNPISLFSLS